MLPSSPFRFLNFILRVAAGIAGLALSPAFAITDGNGDGYDDLWQSLHGVTTAAMALTDDQDGDGSSNITESEAGTDPRDSEDYLRVAGTTLSATTLSLSVDTQAGKRYQLKSSPTPGGPIWTDVGAAVTGTGSYVSLTATIGAGDRLFYRVHVSDQDTDGDGASDWEEGVTGTNPNLDNSLTNASGGIATDGETLRALMSVTAAVIDANGYESPATQARIRVSRSLGTMPLTLPLAFGGATDAKKGSASPTDYSLSGATTLAVTIPANAASQDILVTPLIDSLREVPETLRIFVNLPGLPTTPESRIAAVMLSDKPVAPENQRLFVAYLSPEPNVASSASGVVTALVEGNNDRAVVSLSFSNLSSAQNTAYIRVGSDLEVSRIPNGQISGHIWSIRAAQILQSDQATLDALEAGSLYVSVSSANFPGGEIRGSFQAAAGSIVVPPAPEEPPAFGTTGFPNLAVGGTANNPALDRDIVRFLMQATYGPTPTSIQEVRALIAANGNNALAGYTAWINKQMSTAPGDSPSPSLRSLVEAADIEEFILRGNKPITFGNDPQFAGNSTQFNNGTRGWDASSIHQNNYPFEHNRRREWFTLVLNSRDQLRQRMAFALSEIVVISENDATVDTYHFGAASYWDMLATNAFGPYRTVLEKVTYSPLMGIYLSHLKNQKQSGAISPDENFAREIMQLFSIGLVQRHLDGSLKLDPATALPIPTYDQGDITEMARVMTGLSFGKRHANVSGAATYPSSSTQAIGAVEDNTNFFQGNGHRYWQASWTNDMRMFSAYHDFNAYTTYTGQPLPGGVTSASKILFRGKPGQKVIPPRTASDANGTADITDAMNALAGTPGAGAWDGHPTTPVFISRLLIQRFTTSNPSAGYLYRVATVFQNTKGNLGEVIKAILLDYEARSLPASGGGSPADGIGYGKAKEPLLHFTAILRALQSSTGAPLSNLAAMPVTFTSSQSPFTTAYPATELAKFPAGAKRFRFFDTESNLTQSPLRAPSVFNWFLPDYVVPGPLGAAGLVAPELQVATESNVVNVINFHQVYFFITTPPTVLTPTQLNAGTRFGRGVDNFFNLSLYRTAGGTQLEVPAYGRPYHATNNPQGRGYFLKSKFDPLVPLEVPESINDQLDNVNPDYVSVETLYNDAYNASLVSQYGAGNVPPAPGTGQKAVAHDAAAVVVVDHYDSLFTAGYLKARFGSAPGANPRQYILDALASGRIGDRTFHSDNVNYRRDVVVRIKNIAYLVGTSPQALVLK
jgi:uncharacterized protein (DUF1800 family)